MEYILRTKNLTKRYKEQISVNNLCMNVEKGDIYGFIGKNGAGKTTTLKMILGLIPPTSGGVNIFGSEVRRNDISYLRDIGSIIEFPSSYEELTAYENLKLHINYMGIRDEKTIDKSLEKLGLLKDRNKKVKNFSLGMKQRLGIARAILHEPKLLILDEPTNGLDPLGIVELRQFILRLASENQLTLIISSHILSELELMINKLGIIDKGVLLKEVAMEEVKNNCLEYADIRVDNIEKAQKILESHFGLNSELIEDKYIRIDLKEKNIKTNLISKLLIDNNLELFELINRRENLEEYFVSLSGGVKL
ncbi:MULTISPECIES: ATP-binding cassette domain-containing protein [Clostridium]|uniref:ATP-binding cassette domain-containing protein n=1 Tax=Clostridium cibarium TaxID=2762247 RepID=A0ABR8PST2_9CLOT|nr:MULTISPECIES: ATP-binding cassette domain-containing protein [Clostridium]MBD7911185.1 ATP-binding cassette domain-containing protein [Clostridium cibarium]